MEKRGEVEMTKKRFTVHKYIENCNISSDVIDFYVEKLVKQGKTVEDVSVSILDKGKELSYKQCVDLLNQLSDENKQLKQENQQYKSLLRDMGLLMSGEDVMAIRNNFADKIIKPIFAESGFDVDVDTSNGFAISLKEEKE